MDQMMMDVEDALRMERLKAGWARYGSWIVTLATALVVMTAAGTFWHNHVNARLEAQTSALYQTLQTGDAKTDAKAMGAALAKLSPKTKMPLRAVVMLQEAQKWEQAQDLAQARAIYHKLSTMARIPPVLRDLATYHAVRLGLLTGDKPQQLLRELRPITAATSAFNASAMELKGLLLQQQGQTKQANAIFTNLSLDASVPGTLRQRAKAAIAPDVAAHAQ